MKKHRHIDPEYERWFQNYPKFPGVAKCVELLKQTNVTGAWVDIICWQLEEHAAENLGELTIALHAEESAAIRSILMQALEKAALPESLPLWAEFLQSPNIGEQQYAVRALQAINTKEARRLLWEARQINS